MESIISAELRQRVERVDENVWQKNLSKYLNRCCQNLLNKPRKQEVSDDQQVVEDLLRSIHTNNLGPIEIEQTLQSLQLKGEYIQLILNKYKQLEQLLREEDTVDLQGDSSIEGGMRLVGCRVQQENIIGTGHNHCKHQIFHLTLHSVDQQGQHHHHHSTVTKQALLHIQFILQQAHKSILTNTYTFINHL